MPTLRLRRRRDGTWNLERLAGRSVAGSVDQDAADHDPERHARADS